LNFIYVFIGGGLGAMLRYFITKVTPATSSGFPLATFLTNMLACMLLGMLLGYLGEKSLSLRTQLLFITGFCGGFSTFSTFSAETFRLFENGNSAVALVYIAVSVVVSLIGIYVGLKIVA